jgi:hypothetical protein
MRAAQQELKSYRRLWIVVTVATLIGLGLTVALNVMHAPDSFGGRLVGGSPPVFVLICLELISRIPSTHWSVSIGRFLATIAVVGLAFYISYGQQRAFILDLGFPQEHAKWFPIIIDGAMVVCALSLVEVTRKVRALRLVMLGALDDTPVQRVPVTPADVQAEEAGRRFREAAAKPFRIESAVPVLNGKPVLEKQAA